MVADDADDNANDDAAPTSSLSSISPSLSTATKASAGTALKLSRIAFVLLPLPLLLLSALGGRRAARGEGTEADFDVLVDSADADAADAPADAASLALPSSPVLVSLATSSRRCAGAAPTTPAL